jgi:hypothetical protein
MSKPASLSSSAVKPSSLSSPARKPAHSPVQYVVKEGDQGEKVPYRDEALGVSFKIRVPETVRVGTTLKVTIHTCFRCDFSLGGWSSSWPYRRAGEDFCKKCWHARV